MTSEDYFHFGIGAVMAIKVNYIVGNRKYHGGHFSPAGCHIPFANLITNQKTVLKGNCCY